MRMRTVPRATKAERRAWSKEKRDDEALAIALRAGRKARQIEAETGEPPSSVTVGGIVVAFRW